MAGKIKNFRVGKKDDTQLAGSTRISSTFASRTNIKIYSFILLIIFINALFPIKKIYKSFDIPKEGDITKKAIIAPFTFDILKTEEELKKERTKAINKVLPVMGYDYDITEKMFNKFKGFFNKIRLLRNRSVADSVKRDTWIDLKKDISVKTIKIFIRSKINFENMLYVIDNILDEGIFSVLLVKDLKERDDFKNRYNLDFINYRIYKGDFVTLLRDDNEETVSIKDLMVKEEIIEREKARLKKRFPRRVFSAVYELIYAYISPNIFFLD